MTPRIEKMVMILVSAALASLAYLFADDEAVRGLLMMLAGAPAGGALLPRAEERKLRKVAQHSRDY